MIEISKLPLNDEVAQCYRKMRRQTKEYVEQRTNEIENCDHLFVLIEKGKTIPEYNSSDYEYHQNKVECVHCGLTSRFLELEKRIKGMDYSISEYNTSLESRLFVQLFKSAYSRKTFKEFVINLISEKPLPTYHPGLLYRIASEMYPQADNQEIFRTMKKLHSLETPQEKFRLQTIEQAQDLIDRFKKDKPSSLMLK